MGFSIILQRVVLQFSLRLALPILTFVVTLSCGGSVAAAAMSEVCTDDFGVGRSFFGIGYIKKEGAGNRIGLVAFVYLLLSVFPTLLLSTSLLISVSYPESVGSCLPSRSNGL